jgi:phospholipase C
MTSREFTFWLKGYITAQHDSQMKLDIEKALGEIKDYDDNPDLEDEEDGWTDWYQHDIKDQLSLSGSITSSSQVAVSFSTGSSSHTQIYSTSTVWNDKMGAWHYTNYPDGFGYYHRQENKKQQLND